MANSPGGNGLVRMEPRSGMLTVADHGGYAHLSHTHFSFVRFPTRNYQLLSGSNTNNEKDRVLVLCQVLPVSDHYLLFYFQLRVSDGSPQRAQIQPKTQVSSEHSQIICTLQWLLPTFKNLNPAPFWFLFFQLNLHKRLYFP